jgi:hypothetical protein
MKQILLFLFAILLITSCAKKRTAVVKGRVLNPVTGEGISNAKITMYHSKLTSYDNDIKVDAQTLSASDGSFEISSKGFKAYELACILDGDYYYLRWSVDGAYKSSFQPLEGKTQEVDFHVVPYGMIQLHIRNTSCFNSSDEIKLYYDGASKTNYAYNIGLMSTLNGCVDITDPPIKTTSDFHYFHLEVTKNGTSNTYYDTIFVNTNGVTIFEVLY